MKPPEILVVEDNPINRKLLRSTLAPEGYQVVEAESGEAALRLAAELSPSLILLDLILPDTDGVALLERLRRLPSIKDVPVIAFTGFLSKFEASRITQVGFTDLITKPCEPSRLLEVVRGYLPAAVSSETPGRGRSILYVDDDPVQLKLGALRLKELGFRVECAPDGRSALERLAQARPDAVLSDILMPVMDGLRLCLEIRRDPAFAGLPVVLVSSSFVEPSDFEKAREVGASALAVRTSDYREAIAAVLKSLKEGPPPAPSGQVDLGNGELHARLIAKLDRLSAVNSGLLRRSSLETASLSVLAAISAELATQGDIRASLDRILARCLDAAGLREGVILEAGTACLRVIAQCGAKDNSEVLETFSPHRELIERTIASGAALAVSAADAAQDGWRELLRRRGAQALVMVPMHWSGRRGVMVLFSELSGEEADHWTGFAGILAAQLGQALTLSESFARLREAEETLALFGANLSEVLWMADASLEKIFYVSPAYEAVWGRSAAGLYRDPMDWAEAILPQDRERVIEEHRKAGEAGGLSTEYRIRRPDGSVRWIKDGCRCVRDASGAVARLVGIAEDITERKIAAEAAEADRDRITLLLDSTAEGIYGVDLEGRCTFVNKACLRMLGYDAPAELLGRRVHDAMHHSRADGSPYPIEACPVYQASHSGRSYHAEDDMFWRKDGTPIAVEFWTYPLSHGGKVIGSVATFIDIGERKKGAETLARSEAQLRQAQKMESVGRLAGGVAHDFNNLLTAILGLSELTMENLPEDHPSRKDIAEIRQTAMRAANLTHQLLAFSRKQIIEPRIVDLNELVSNLQKMLRRIIGEDVSLTLSGAAGLWPTRVDPHQLEQVVVNLCINARDALLKDGRITLETANTSVGERFKQDLGLAPGDYVVLAITDNGTGMSEEVKRHLFEPFFTTKSRDKGTGLGLATCYGIVKQSGGHISVYSEPGRGTTVKVYLPRAVRPQEETAAAPAAAASPHGEEAVLIVEDEPAVRRLLARMLNGLGYRVQQAADPEEGLKVAQADSKKELRLLITDVVMPKGGGKFLVTELAKTRPDIRVLYTSGYTDDAIVRHGALEPGVQFLSKPYDLDTLARKIRETLA